MTSKVFGKHNFFHELKTKLTHDQLIKYDEGNQFYVTTENLSFFVIATAFLFSLHALMSHEFVFDSFLIQIGHVGSLDLHQTFQTERAFQSADAACV